MEAKEEDILKFSKLKIQEIIDDRMNAFSKLEKGDHISFFNFVCALACDEDIDAFVTECPLLLESRDNLMKRTGIPVVTIKEALKLSELLHHNSKRS